MNHQIYIGGDVPALTNIEEIEIFISKILNREMEKTIFLSLYFFDQNSIKEINFKYRNKNKSTNVLSFAFNESDFFINDSINHLGEIFISMDDVISKMEFKNMDIKKELFYTITHGLLHLLGYDHQNDSDLEVMQNKELNLMNSFYN
jgi:probable rRNA maturation factor